MNLAVDIMGIYTLFQCNLVTTSEASGGCGCMTVIRIACVECATEFSFVVDHTPKVVWCPVCGLWQRLVAVPAQPVLVSNKRNRRGTLCTDVNKDN